MDQESKKKIDNLLSLVENNTFREEVEAIKVSSVEENACKVATDFIKHSFKELEQEKIYIKTIRSMILKKIFDNPDEVDIDTLARLLDKAQLRNNDGVEKLLLALKPSQGNFTFFDNFENEKSVENEIFETTDPKILRLLQNLNSILSLKKEEAE